MGRKTIVKFTAENVKNSAKKHVKISKSLELYRTNYHRKHKKGLKLRWIGKPQNCTKSHIEKPWESGKIWKI